MAGSETVKVIVRCRPMNKRENDLKSKNVVSMVQGVTCALTNSSEGNIPPKSFTFDGAYFIDSTTEQIYNDVAFSLVESVTEGYNGTVFAYGQTGCGKSFTMQGITMPANQKGITPRSFEHIFEVIQTAEDMKFLVHASYLEIYNEEIRDLLGTDVKKKLDLKEHPEKGVYVQGLSQHSVHNTAECEMIMEKGWSNRSTGSTLMNADSSRSHSIFTIALEMMNMAKDSDTIRSGKLNLVDLAGSERQAKTGATGDRLKEATKINLSLSALGNVISALVDGKSKHIPYRDSKLTRLLQDSLGGNTKTLMVACLSPADNNYDETLSTLRYANRAKNIKNKPKINEDPKDAMLREYQEEIRKLRELLVEKGPESKAQLVVDESAIAVERDKVRSEYEHKMKKMTEDMKAERDSKVILQENMQQLKNKYEMELRNINEKKEENYKSNSNNEVNMLANGSDTDIQEENSYFKEMNTPTKGMPKMQNAEMMTSMQQEALKRLKELQHQMVGGEKAQDTELKAKRLKRKRNMEKRMKYLSEALKNVDDEDGIMIRVYDDIHEELKAKTDVTKKLKQKVKSMDQEIRDLTREFQNERTDYLESIRKLDQQFKLVHAIMERVQPTIRRDCNYSDLDSIKKDSIWDDEYQRWKVPDLTVIKTKLPPAAGILQALGLKCQQNAQSNCYPETDVMERVSPLLDLNNSVSSDDQIDTDSQDAELEPTFINFQPSEQNYLQKLQRSDDMNLASSYFKPKRARELLGKFSDDSNMLPSIEKLKKASKNLGLALGGPPISSNIDNSMGSSPNSSWNCNRSSSPGANKYGSTGTLHTFGSVNGWLGGNNGKLSSLSPEFTKRKPNRLEALQRDKRTNGSTKDKMDFL